MQPIVSGSDSTLQFLLFCGVLAALLHLVADRLAGTLLSDYDFAVHSMSELGASGSPVRPLVVSLACAATLLMIAFGVGIWRAAGPAVLPRAVAVLVIGNAVLGFVATLLFPPSYGERPAFASPGVLLSFLSVLCFVFAMTLGAVAFSGWMRLLSVAIPLSYVLLAGLRLSTAAAQGAPSTIGAQERTMAFSYLLWVMALAIHLLLLRNTLASGPGAP